MANCSLSPEEIRERLLNAAKELFLTKGIAGTEMKEISARAGLSRSTLYRYVMDRNQLSFMVSTQVLTELTDKSLSVAMNPSLSGYEKLCHFAHHFVDTLCENISLVNYLSEFDSLSRGEYPNIPEAREYSATMNRLLHRSAQFMFEGLADKSIRPLDNPLFFISVLVNTILGLGQRLLPRNVHYMEEHNSSARDIILYAADILLDDIKFRAE